jgi:hypothetical protein
MPRKRTAPRKSARRQATPQDNGEAIYDLDVQPTDLSIKKMGGAASYSDAFRSEVEVESLPSEVVLRYITKWTPVLAALGIVVAVVYAFSSFQNDIANAKTEIIDLKKVTKNSGVAIRGLEDAHIVTNLTLTNLSDSTSRLNGKIEKFSAALKSVEIEQVKANHNHVEKVKLVSNDNNEGG